MKRPHTRLEPLRREVVVCFGFERDRVGRQPWHVARGIALGLAANGRDVTLVTDAVDPPPGEPYRIRRIDRLFHNGQPSDSLTFTVRELEPERVTIVIGAHQLLRGAQFRLDAPVSLVMASPRHRLAEFARLGPLTLWRERQVLRLALVNALLPGSLLRRGLRESNAAGIVYLSDAAQQRYTALGLPAGQRIVPQVEGPLAGAMVAGGGPRRIAYLGPPLALRGAGLAIEAFERATAAGLDARLVMLLRGDGSARQLAAILRRIERSPRRHLIEVQTGTLARDLLRQLLCGCHVFLLPFRLTVSEVPLVVIEAGLSGRPVVTLDTPGVSEYTAILGGIVTATPAGLPQALVAACRAPARPMPDPAHWTNWTRAVAPLLEAHRRPLEQFRMVCLCGVDGVGKTTLLQTLRGIADEHGVPNRHVWSRFRNYLSKPLLALARLTGHNRKETVAGVRVGYHDFADSPVLRWSFLTLQVADNVLDILIRYRLQMRGRLVVGDRCVVDTLVDLAIDTGLDGLLFGRLGRWLVRRLPGPRLIVVLDREPVRIGTARPDALADRHFLRRRQLYLEIAHRMGLPVIDNNGAPEAAMARIMDLVAAGRQTEPRP